MASSDRVEIVKVVAQLVAAIAGILLLAFLIMSADKPSATRCRDSCTHGFGESRMLSFDPTTGRCECSK